MDSRTTKVAVVAFFVMTLAIPVVYYLVLNATFAAPNTFEDGLGYLVSAERMLAEGSPYQVWQLDGPYGAVTASDTYRYPPPFAQVTALFVLTGTEGLFIAIVVATCFIATLVLARSRRDVALGLWIGLAFLPNWNAAWHAQVSGLLAMTIGLAIRGQPMAIWAGTALKVTPALALPAAAVAMGRALAASAIVLVPFAAVSLILSPRAWAEFPAVLINQFLGGTDDLSLAPVGAGRPVALLVAAACVVAAVGLARSRWALAFYLAVVAGLLAPGFFPKYALPVLVPFLFIGLRDRRGRPWSVAAFFALAYPFISFSLPVFAGLVLLGVSTWRLERHAVIRPPPGDDVDLTSISRGFQ